MADLIPIAYLPRSNLDCDSQCSFYGVVLLQKKTIKSNNKTNTSSMQSKAFYFTLLTGIVCMKMRN